jgi:hypothetical protein
MGARLMAKAKRRGNMVYVEWRDASGHSPGWKPLEDALSDGLVVCHSVGWIVRETKRELVMVADWNENQQFDRELTIPCNQIVSRKILR